MSNVSEDELAAPADQLSRMRHTTSHVLAQAVRDLIPETKMGIGPVIENGFYYDFDLPRPLTEADLETLEQRMREIVKANLTLTRFVEPREQARERCLAMGQEYKVRLIDDLPDEAEISFYQQGDFVDLCKGPHIESTGKIGAFKLTHLAGAYWRGNAKNEQLTRVYGVAFPTKKELEEYLERLEEAKKRDHKVLGKQLGLFMGSPLVGPGLPLWLPNGAAIRRTLERYIQDMELKHGYEHVYTPVLAHKHLYEVSGHWEHYKDGMFPVMEIDGEEFVLRPMNCPHHIQIFKNEMHSYRELPIRYAELGTMYRWEKSGELSGLSRVRAMTLSDAHIFCQEDQVKEEVKKSILLIEESYRALGIKEFRYRLSLHDPDDNEKYVKNPALWEKAEGELREVFQELGLPYFEGVGEAAFYGPKVDIQLKNVLGREETVSTVQVDRHLPEKFELEYIGDDSRPHRPVMIHRGYLSTMERMISFLIEHYAGAFPVWLAPVQAVVIPLKTDDPALLDYVHQIEAELKQAEFRVKLDERNESVNRRVRDAELAKIPLILVAGGRDRDAGVVDIRLGVRGKEMVGPLSTLLEDEAAWTARLCDYASAEALDPVLRRIAGGEVGRVGALSRAAALDLLRFLRDTNL